MKIVLLFFLFSINCVFSQGENRPLVRSKSGDIRGVWETSSSGKKYAAFMGIPYAKPPVGNLRYEPPKPAEKWQGVLDGGMISPDCMQYSIPPLVLANLTEQIHGQEDCLYLNVFSPNLNISAPMPVIVFIHGGAFMFGGSSAYGARYIMNYNVVFVTINYRLGPLGFLSFEDSVQPGNNGMRDQVMALKWIQNNICPFGGNPDEVTISGCSAGGASVHYHYLSPMSRGLFKRGISLSGSSLSRWALAEKARDTSMRISASVGCPTNINTEQIIKCLKSRRAEDVVSKVSELQVWQYSPFSPFAPTVEISNKGKSVPPFLPDDPIKLLFHGDFYRAPWISGLTTHEGLYPAAQFIANAEELNLLDKDFERLMPHVLHFNLTVKPGEQEEIARLIRKEYLGDKSINFDTVPQVVELMSDRLFDLDSQRAAEMHAKYSEVYFYLFGYRGKYSLSDILSGTKQDFGVSHGDDMAYFMNVTYITDHDRTGMEKQVETLILELFTSFAYNGVPSSNEAPVWQTVKHGGDLVYLNIDKVPPTMKTTKDFARTKFWDSLPFMETAQCNTKYI